MAKRRRPPRWFSMLPGGKAPTAFTLDELRSVKWVHAFLNERIEGPAEAAEFIRGFRFLLFFGLGCIAEDKYPPLTRCWKDLDRLFTGDPSFDDGVFVPSWVFMDFPFGPKGETALDYFAEFLTETEVGSTFEHFVAVARASRLGLYQDVMRTKDVAKFRELISGRVITAFPSIEHYEKGEILLGRAMGHGDTVYFIGDPKGFPKEMKDQIEEMVEDKLFYFDDADPLGAFERFMKLAGPYWMSCVTKNESIPILPPDHYRSYLAARK